MLLNALLLSTNGTKLWPGFWVGRQVGEGEAREQERWWGERCRKEDSRNMVDMEEMETGKMVRARERGTESLSARETETEG